MWKKILKAWNIFWGIVGGLAVLVGAVVGVYALYDRFSPRPIPPPPVKEYIFGSKYYYVQALTDSANKVLAYGITTRDKNFIPSFTILQDLYYADPKNPSDETKLKSGAEIITLGKTKFSDIGTPDNIFAYLGVHDFYYHEEYYYGNPGNYQSFFFAANESGYLDVDNDSLDFFLSNKKIDPMDSTVVTFRKNSIINTIYITAPGEGFDNVMLRKYLVGPDYNQVRAISESAMQDVADVQAEYKKLLKLSSGVDLENFIAILGRPLIVNDEPTFNIRTDKTLNQQFDERLNDNPS